MDLNRLKLFTRVVEVGSLTRAAEELGVTTSSVSRALSRLEAELGVRLLQRTPRRLGLTAAGRGYFDQVRSALARVQEANDAAARLGAEPVGVVRLTAPPSLADVLMPLIADFLERHPKIRVEASFERRLVDLVAGGVDVAVRVGRLADSTLIARSVGSLRGAFFASRDYLRRRGSPRSLAELASHDCVLFRNQSERGVWRLFDGARVRSVEVNGRFNTDETTSLHEAVRAGIGIGNFCLFAGTRMPGLVRVLPEYVSADMPVSVVAPSRLHETPATKLLRESLVAKLSAMQWLN